MIPVGYYVKTWDLIKNVWCTFPYTNTYYGTDTMIDLQFPGVGCYVYSPTYNVKTLYFLKRAIASRCLILGV